MAIQPIGGVSAAAFVTPVTGTDEPRGAERRAAADSQDSTIVVSMVTRTRDDGSTVTTITYADGHTKTETTPPKSGAVAGGTEGDEGRLTAVDILA